MAENPAVMTASGWKQNSDKTWEQKPDEGSKQLADNLATISTFSPTNPATVLGGAVVKTIPYLSKTVQYGLAKSGNKWAKAKVLSKEMDNLVPESFIKQETGIYRNSIPSKETINYRTAESINSASQRLQNIYNSPEYYENLQRAYQKTGNKSFANSYIPNSLIDNLKAGIEITPDKNFNMYGETLFNLTSRRPIISIRARLPQKDLNETALHEVAHASLKGGNASKVWTMNIEPYLRSIIELRKPKEIVKNFGLGDFDFKRLGNLMNFKEYATDVNEIRSRMFSLIDQSKRSGMRFNDFIDKHSFSNVPSYSYGKLNAPQELEDLLKIMTPEEIKKLSKYILGVSLIPKTKNSQPSN